jgi:voltage-gated potassium channel
MRYAPPDQTVTEGERMTDAPAAPSAEADRPAELQAPAYEIFIGLLAVISLFNLAVSVLPFSPAQKEIAALVDVPLTLIFLLDFTSRLLRSKPKRVYFVEQRGWLDLLGSLPSFFRLFRIFRLVRVTRLLGEYGPRNIARSFIKHRADNALIVVLFLVLLVLEFGSMFVTFFEQQSPDANIKTGGDAVWWAFVSITTVGYGDQFPVTTGGRTMAVFVLATGVGLFGVLSGYLANFFLAPAPKEEDAAAAQGADAATTGVRAPTGPDDGEDLLRMVDDLEASVSSLRARLADRSDAAGGI